jgi:hypothetical protein
MHVGETISVIASFGLPHKIRPLRFKWSGKLLEVKEVTFFWTEKEGQKNIYHFSVSDGRTLYELSFDAIALLWRLETLEA